MMTMWIELTFALAGEAAIGFWTGWRLRSADVARAEGEAERIRVMWMQMAEDDDTPEPTLHGVADESELPPKRRATG